MASDKKFSKIETIHTLNIDIDGRRIYLFDEIDYDVSAQIIKNVHFLDQTDGDISIYICTPGGDWCAGWGIYETIKRAKNRIIGHAVGDCSSMGAIILQACDWRMAGERTTILIHPGQTAFEGHVMDSIKKSEWEKSEMKIMYNMFWDRMNAGDEGKIPNVTYKKFINEIVFDTYLTGPRALELCIIDELEA